MTNSNSYISITQKPISIKLKPPSNSTFSSIHNYKLPGPHRFSRYFLPFFSIWALLTVSQLYFSPLPCPHYLRRIRSDPQPIPNDEFWTWARSGVAGFKPCINFTESYFNESRTPAYKRYMLVVVSGGLNQQRNQIIDAVVIARILRAVLVAPILQVNQIWGDESEFGDLFDISHFKETLKHDVKVVSALPATHLMRRRIKAPLMPFNAGEEWVRTNYGGGGKVSFFCFYYLPI
ncbi:O-fucosyltransferase 20-like isoform X1 [Carex rostrata]